MELLVNDYTLVCVSIGVGGVLAKTFQDGPLAGTGLLVPYTRIPQCWPPLLNLSDPLSQRPPASSCQVYGSKVTMKPLACENIKLQKHPWVRGCVNGAFSAGPNPSPALLTDGQQMAFCVHRWREERRKKREEAQRKEGLEIFQASSVEGPIRRSLMPYHMARLTSGPHSAKAVRLLLNREHKVS